MPLDPIVTSNFFLKLLAALDHLSSWLISSIAIFLIVFLCVPEFQALAPPVWLPWIKCAAALFTILAVSKIICSLFSFFSAHLAKFSARRFHVTPSHQCDWSISPQPDGTIITHIHGHFLAKNRTTAPIQLVRARLITPKIRGEVLHDLVLIRAVRGNEYGSASISDRVIPPEASLPVVIDITVRGTPRQKHGELTAVIAVMDEEGNEQRVKTHYKAMHPKTT